MLRKCRKLPEQAEIQQLRTWAEAEAGSAFFNVQDIEKRMPACGERSDFVDLGGSESGLSPQFQEIFGRVERNGTDNSSNK